MTREEAIQVLKEYRTIVMNCLKAGTPAFDMAIEALSAESETLSHEEAWKQIEGDLISRADAIEAVEQEYKIDRGYMADDYTYGFNQAIQYVSDIILQDLPSAETTGALDDAIAKYVADGFMELPSAEAVQVVRCKDCEYSFIAQTDSNGTMQRFCKHISSFSRYVDDDDFCSWAKMKGGAE